MDTQRKSGRRSSFLSRRGRWVGSSLDRRLHLEPLEDRRMLAITVDTLVDEFDGSIGDISLRDALAVAVSGETIDFAAGLNGGTINLSQAFGEVAITKAVTIDASSLADGITIDAGDGTDGVFGNGNGFRVFNIDDSTGTEIDVELIGLTLTGGDVSGTGDGGAIFSRENLTLTSSTISGNSAGGDGGGIFANSSTTTTITSSTITGNSAGFGGGISASGTTTITSSTISGNLAGGDGGGIYAFFGTTAITSSTISGNQAGSNGGGILANSGTTITSSTITGNSAGDDGGGIFANSGTTTIISSTITGNRADADNNGSGAGGGIRITSSPVTLSHTLVAGNDLGNSTADDISGTVDSASNFNLIGVNTGLSGITNGGVSGNQIGTSGSPLDPLLGSLADNGGPTKTHALLAGSPAIDAGNLGIASPPNFDQRGAPFVRVFGGVIDIGALEDQPIPESADFDNDGDIDGADFLAWQRGFGSSTPAQSDGDANNDGNVDGDDLDIWQSQFGQPAPIVAAASAVSESEDEASALASAVAFETLFSEPAAPADRHRPGDGVVGRCGGRGNAGESYENGCD